MSTLSLTTTQHPATCETEPPIVCAFVRGSQVWRFVFSKADAGETLRAATKFTRSGDLDAFDLAWLDLLIRRALRTGGSRCTTNPRPSDRRREASGQRRFISPKTWNKD